MGLNRIMSGKAFKKQAYRRLQSVSREVTDMHTLGPEMLRTMVMLPYFTGEPAEA